MKELHNIASKNIKLQERYLKALYSNACRMRGKDDVNLYDIATNQNLRDELDIKTFRTKENYKLFNVIRTTLYDILPIISDFDIHNELDLQKMSLKEIVETVLSLRANVGLSFLSHLDVAVKYFKDELEYYSDKAQRLYPTQEVIYL